MNIGTKEFDVKILIIDKMTLCELRNFLLLHLHLDTLNISMKEFDVNILIIDKITA